MQQASDYLLWGIIVHLIADWLLQTNWMALHKSKLRHPASWVHSGIHATGLCLVFPWPAALLIGGTHLLIDTRRPLRWWMRVVKQMPLRDRSPTVEIWLDQVMHITVLAMFALGYSWIFC